MGDAPKADATEGQRNWRSICEKCLEQAKQQPTNPIPLVNAAYANLQRQLYRKALKNAEQAISVDDSCLKAYLLGSKILLKLKKRKKALSMIKKGILVASKLDDATVYYDTLDRMEAFCKQLSTSVPKAAPKESNGIVSYTKAKRKEKKVQNITPMTKPDVEAHKSNKNAMKITLESDESSGTRSRLADNVTRKHIEVASKALTNRTGVKEIDEAIALAYLKVNTGAYSDAISIFDHILSVSPDIYPVLLGRGSAYALTANFDGAIKDLSRAIQISPEEPDGFKRLGQVLGAVGHVREATAALKTAQRLDPKDHDSFQQCATIYHKNRNYREAIVYFRETIKVYKSSMGGKSQVATAGTARDSKLAVYWNYVGLCENAIGKNLVAVEAYKEALKYDAQFKEALVNMGQAFRDYGMAQQAQVQFERALEIDTEYIHALHLRGLMFHAEGRMQEALQDFLKSLVFDPKHSECRVMAGIALHGVGNLTEAIKHYTVLVEEENPENIDDVQSSMDESESEPKGKTVAKFGSPCIWAWYQREMACYLQSVFDRKLNTFHFSRPLHSLFKELLTKRQPPKELLRRGKGYEKIYSETERAKINDDVVYKRSIRQVEDGSQKTNLALLLPHVLRYGKLLQLKSPGFLSNRRQHRQCGYAILEMAQTIRREWRQEKPTICSGKVSSSHELGHAHPFGWRDFFDIAVKWRQFSEPNDPVFWIDNMTKEAFEEGFGLQTPMITGQLHVPRYYPYFNKAFDAIKGLIDQQCPLTDELRESVYNAQSGIELYKIMARDFWVVSPCYRLSDPAQYLEGTRLTMIFKQPDGIEFTTRMPGLPERYKEYSIEMEYVFDRLKVAMKQQKSGTSNEGRSEKKQKEIGDLILSVFYLWVTFAPLTRGSAATGYAALYALFLAADMPIQSGPPNGVQADFEAFLEPKVDVFIRTIRKKWLDKPGVVTYAKNDRNIDWDKTPNVSSIITTPRELIEALNIEEL